MAKVFLSYAREDASAAKQLAERIGGAGHTVWWDRHIQGGSRFASEIDRELKEADAVVVLWTAASVDSAWVQDEAAEGRDTARLVPVVLDGVRPPLGFRQFHTVDLGSWNGKPDASELGDLLDAVAKIAGETAAGKASADAMIQPARRGASVWYLAARALGVDRLKPFIERHGRWLTLNWKDIEQAEVWFRRNGVFFVFLGRLLPTVRSLVSIPAGLLKMRFRSFLFASTLGTLGWTALLAGAGYKLRENFAEVDQYLGPVSNAVIVVLVGAYLWRLLTFRSDTEQD